MSYRRSDTEAITGRIFDRMQSHYGDGNVIIDIDSFPFGHDFRRAIATEIEACDAVIAVIGRHWAGDENRRRIGEENDFVRIELEAALARNIPLVPLLVDGASHADPVRAAGRPAGTGFPKRRRGRCRARLSRSHRSHPPLARPLLGDRRALAATARPKLRFARAAFRPAEGSPSRGPRVLDVSRQAYNAAPAAIADDLGSTPLRRSADATRQSRRPASLAEHFERISERHETVNVTVFALVGGFLLCMASALADVHIVSRVDQGIVKQVGFLYARTG